jgi:hypothetical protein
MGRLCVEGCVIGPMNMRLVEISWEQKKTEGTFEEIHCQKWSVAIHVNGFCS